ncbi:MAG TPA: dipeptidase [Longimicrobiales bacterium]
MTRSTTTQSAVPALLVSLLTACAGGAARPGAPDPGGDAALATAVRVLSSVPLIDGHNDLPWEVRQSSPCWEEPALCETTNAPADVAGYDLRTTTPGHTDIARLRAGMVGIQFWSIYIPYQAVEVGAARTQLEQIDIAKRIFESYPDALEETPTVDAALDAWREGRVASVLGMEGGHAIENSLGALRSYYRLGARYMTLTHSANIDWADSCCEAPELGGLSPFGVEVVREMNRLGMMVDLSHVSPETMHDALDATEAPVIFSHSSARGVTDHPRNVPDDVLRRLPDNGGVVMITFVPGFISNDVRAWESLPREQRDTTPAPRATMADAIAHIEHVRDVAGIEHVGIGGDFDGISSVPVGLEDVSTYPALFAELARRGWSEAELKQLAGENVLRVWREVERVAARLQRERAPSTMMIQGPAEAER